MGATRQIVADDVATDFASHGAGQFTVADHHVGAERTRQGLLMRIPGADDDSHTGDVSTQSDHSRESHGAGTENGDDRSLAPLGRAANHRPRGEGGVHAAGERLDQHGGFVAHVIGDVVQLTLVCDEFGRPTTTGRTTKAGLNAGFERSADEMGVVVAVTRCGIGERERQAARRVPEHGFDDDSSSLVGHGDDLVTGNEGKRDPIEEVGGGPTLDE